MSGTTKHAPRDGETMRRVRMGRSDVHLSVVGMGACQLRLVPEAQAVATVREALAGGVDWFHASPDYHGADELITGVIREEGADAFVLGDGSGTMDHFERCYERALELNGGGPLPMWGISCIDDQEFVGHDVWGPHGMVEFLLREQRRGRIRALYCTTHAPAERVESLITTGVFDAIMLAWNPLGFHVLSSYAEAEGKDYEDLGATRERVFPLALEHDVSLLVMKSLGGGLLTESRAFPPRALLADQRRELDAEEVLRYVLSVPGVSAVVSGAAEPSEARMDARAGHGEAGLPDEHARVLEDRVASMRTTLCSRCGDCESTCSRDLPISWLFRDAYMLLNPADSFDAVARLDYRHLLGGSELACATCDDRTCLCPADLDVPRELTRAVDAMERLAAAGRLPLPPVGQETAVVAAPLGEPRALVVQQDRVLGETWRLWIENVGRRPWTRDREDDDHVVLEVSDATGATQRYPLRDDCHPAARTHFAFAPPSSSDVEFSLYAPRRGQRVVLPDGSATP